MTTFRTTPPLTYLTPTREEMAAMADQVGLRKYAPDLVEDISNLLAGGELVAPSRYGQQVRAEAEKSLPPADHDGEWQLRDRSWTKDRQRALAEKTESRMRYHQRVQDFLRDLDATQMPGTSPLEKAMGWLKLLAAMPGGEGSGQGGEEALPIFTDEQSSGEAVAEQLEEAVGDAKSLSDEERELLDAEGTGEDDEQSSDSPKNPGADPSQVRRLAEKMLRGEDELLRVSRHLDKLSPMRVAKSNKLEADPEGDERRWRPIRNLGELHKIPQSEWALPKSYRMYRALTGQTPVRERCVRTEKRQLLYILIDCSGSMGSGQRIAKAGGVLLNRLKAVVAGEAEVYFRFFDGSPRQEHHAATPEEAKALMTKVMEAGNYSGGSTDIRAAVQAAAVRIEELIASGEQFYRPEICLVSDGEADVPSRDDLGKVRLHVFNVECAQQELVELARSTGGVGIDRL